MIIKWIESSKHRLEKLISIYHHGSFSNVLQIGDKSKETFKRIDTIQIGMTPQEKRKWWDLKMNPESSIKKTNEFPSNNDTPSGITKSVS